MPGVAGSVLPVAGAVRAARVGVLIRIGRGVRVWLHLSAARRGDAKRERDRPL